MTAHCLFFFHPLGHDLYPQMLALASENWRDRGWTVHVVSADWIPRHPVNPLLENATANSPSACSSKAFERLCFLRWGGISAYMDHHSIPWAFAGDFDIVNLSFSPDLAASTFNAIGPSMLGGGALLLDQLSARILPAALLASEPSAQAPPQLFLPSGHSSDLLCLNFLANHSPPLLFRPSPPLVQSYVPAFASPDFSPDFPLVHAHGFNQPYDRLAAMRYVLNPGATSIRP